MPKDVSQEVVEKARTLSPEDALKACGETEGLDDIAQRWDESGAQMPYELPGYLTKAQWRECREWGGLGPEVDEVLRRTAGAISQSPALLRLSWHCYWRVYLCPEACPPRGWPEFTAMLGDDAGVFYMLVGLGVIPLMRKWHAELGIPEARRPARRAATAMTCTGRATTACRGCTSTSSAGCGTTPGSATSASAGSSTGLRPTPGMNWSSATRPPAR